MTLNVTLSNRRAWTGGDKPPQRFRRRDPNYRRLVTFFFREQLQQCGGLDFWKGAGTSSLERARIFWNRARLDGWRTYTESRPYPSQLVVAFKIVYKGKPGDGHTRLKLGKLNYPIGETFEYAEDRVRREFPEANAVRHYDENGNWCCSSSL